MCVCVCVCVHDETKKVGCCLVSSLVWCVVGGGWGLVWAGVGVDVCDERPKRWGALPSLPFVGVFVGGWVVDKV